MQFINTVSSFTAMNYLLHNSKSAMHLFNPVTNACRSVRYWSMLSRTICTTVNTHYPSFSLVDRRLSSINYGDNRSCSPGSSSSGGFKKYLPVIVTSALLVGVLAFRRFVNSEPDSESLLKDARKRVEKMLKPQSSSEVDNASDLISPARSGLSSSSPTFSTYKKEIDKEKEGFTDKMTRSTESATVSPDQENEKDSADFKNAESSEIKCIDPAKHGFPSHVRYLIIGAGTAGMAAARAIRASDPTARVLMLAGAEPSVEGVSGGREPPPYLRPALSKELWRRSRDRESKILNATGDMRRHSWLYYEPESFFMEAESLNAAEYGGVALLRGDPAVSLDPDRQTVYLKSGRQLSFDRCLLATGGRPKQLPHNLEQCCRTNTNLLQSGHVSYFRTLADYRNLRKIRDSLQKTGGRIAVVGGGFLGSELTVSLLTEPANPSKTDTGSEIASAGENQAKKEPSPLGVSVMHIFQESAPMGHVLPPCLTSAISRFEASLGADLRSSAELIGISLVTDKLSESSSSQNSATVEWTDNRLPLKALQTVAASQVDQQETNSHQRIRIRLRRNDDIFSPAVVEDVEVDHLVCAIGLEANTELASSAGLEIDHNNGGFLVNAELESRGGVYVAGDAASYWDPVLACRRRVEHLNFAEETGILAGMNMAASLAAHDNSAAQHHNGIRYHYQSSVWSNLGLEVNWDAVGLVDSRNLLTRSFFSPGVQNNSMSVLDSEFGSLSHGVVFYLTPKERRLVGILLWNLPEFIYTDKEFAAPSRLNIARSILAERRVIGHSQQEEGEQMPLSEEQELQQLATEFDIYGELENDYNELKAYIATKRKKLDSPTSEDTENASDPDKQDGDTTYIG